MSNNFHTHKKLKAFVKELIGEQNLTNFIKHFKIKHFQTTTLTPLALLLGEDEFSKFIKNTPQLGGGSNCNIMEDPLTTNYLKLAGLSNQDFDENTLIPLGILKIIHNMYTRNLTQKNGELTKYVRECWDKDIIYLFKKHHDIKRLTTLKLVPLAIIMDKDILVNYLENNQDINMAKSKLKFINDPMLANYFKLIGLNRKNLYISTLVPLGILIVLHHLYCENKC